STPSFPLTETISSRTRQSAPGLDSGGPAVVGPPGPVRPVTLRRQLSVALPLSKSRRNLSDQILSFSNLLVYVPFPLRPAASRRRQEVDWVHDRHGRHILRAEIDRPDAANDLRGEIRRIHVGRLQRTHRHAAIRLDRKAQNHLSFKSWVIAQLPVVQPVER